MCFYFKKCAAPARTFFSRDCPPFLYASIFQRAFYKAGFPQKVNNLNAQQVPVSSKKECAAPIFFSSCRFKSAQGPGALKKERPDALKLKRFRGAARRRRRFFFSGSRPISIKSALLQAFLESRERCSKNCRSPLQTTRRCIAEQIEKFSRQN